VSIGQYGILQLFDKYPIITYKEVFAELGISMKTFHRLLEGLIFDNNSVIIRADSKDVSVINEDTLLKLNEHFVPESGRMVLVKPIWRNAVDTKKMITNVRDPPEVIMKERKVKIQVRIIKIIKIRKTVEMEVLIAEVIKISNEFETIEEQVRQEIQRLEERGFIHKTENNIYSLVR